MDSVVQRGDGKVSFSRYLKLPGWNHSTWNGESEACKRRCFFFLCRERFYFTAWNADLQLKSILIHFWFLGWRFSICHHLNFRERRRRLVAARPPKICDSFPKCHAFFAPSTRRTFCAFEKRNKLLAPGLPFKKQLLVTKTGDQKIRTLLTAET